MKRIEVKGNITNCDVKQLSDSGDKGGERMITVENKVSIYKIDETNTKTPYPEIIVESDCYGDKDFIVIRIFGVSYRVIADDMMQAINNATMIGR